MKRKGQCAPPLFAERTNRVPQKKRKAFNQCAWICSDWFDQKANCIGKKTRLIKWRSGQRKRNEFDGQKNMSISIIDENHNMIRIGPWHWKWALAVPIWMVHDFAHLFLGGAISMTTCKSKFADDLVAFLFLTYYSRVTSGRAPGWSLVAEFWCTNEAANATQNHVFAEILQSPETH